MDAVTAAEIIRNFGYWQEQALNRPLSITHHGRARTVLISIEEFERLNAGGDAPAPDNDALAKIQLTEGMAEGFVVHDAAMRVLDLNQVAADYFGAPREALIGKTMSEALSAPPNQVMAAMLQRVLRTGELVTYDTVSSAFPERRLSVRSFPFGDAVATLFVDVTELENMRDAAEGWAASLDAMALMGRAGLVRLDGRGRVMFTDVVFASLVDYEADVLEGQAFADLVAPADRQRVAAAFDAAIGQRRAAKLDVRIAARSGEERAMTAALAPIYRGAAADGVMVTVTARLAPGEGR